MAKPTMTFDKTKLKEKTTTIDIKTKKNLGQLNLDFLFDDKNISFQHYDIHDRSGRRRKEK